MDIDTVNVVTDDNAAVGIGGNNDIVDAADLIAPEANGDGAQPEERKSAPAPKSERTYTNADVENIVKERLRKQKNAYSLGREMLDEYMAANNLRDEAEALSKIRDERIKAKAAAFKADPQKGFEDLLRMRNQPIQPAEVTQTAGADVDSLFSAIVGDIQAGKVPNGFDLDAYMSEPNRAREFLDLYQSLGMERACSIAMRMNAPGPTKAEQNRALPKPINTNNSYQTANVDFMSMTSEEFAAFDKKIKQARAQGKRVVNIK